jgi:hypothetical protein
MGWLHVHVAVHSVRIELTRRLPYLTGVLLPCCCRAVWLAVLAHIQLCAGQASYCNRRLQRCTRLVRTRLCSSRIFLSAKYTFVLSPSWQITVFNMQPQKRSRYITMIILPRQARDKHRENSKKKSFRQGSWVHRNWFVVLLACLKTLLPIVPVL